jgi:hypothetical protein
VSLFSARSDSACVSCLRKLADIEPPVDATGFERLTCASFYAPKAPGRGRLGICRDCSCAIVAAFAHVVPKDNRK